MLGFCALHTDIQSGLSLLETIPYRHDQNVQAWSPDMGEFMSFMGSATGSVRRLISYEPNKHGSVLSEEAL